MSDQTHINQSEIGVVGDHVHIDTLNINAVPLKENMDLSEEIRGYCEKAESLHDSLPLVGFKTKLRVPIRIEEMYVPLRAMIDLRTTGHMCFGGAEEAEKHLRECDQGREISLVQAFQEIESMNRRGIVLLGDPGSGKTTHLKRLLLWCLRGGLKQLGLPEDMIPVFLPLRELKDVQRGLDDFIQEQFNQRHFETPEGFGREMLNRGNLLFLFDGLDEVVESEHRVKVSRWIEEALTLYKKCCFVVSCRFAGYTEKVQLDSHFLEMHIRPLDEAEVRLFIHNWYTIVETSQMDDQDQAHIKAEHEADSLFQLLKSPEFRARRIFELTRNPLLLTNLCLVHRDRGGTLPKGRARLYEECTEVLLELWRDGIGYQRLIDAPSGRRILQPAALWMHQKEGRTRATAEELAPVIKPALTAMGWQHGTAKSFLDAVRDESGLLTGWDQDNFGFMHLGFQEYLAAKEIRNQAFKHPDILKDLASRFGDSWWQEVILLLLALEDPSLFDAFITEVLKQPKLTEHLDLLELCMDDAAEISVEPFVRWIEQTRGLAYKLKQFFVQDKTLYERQFVAFAMIHRMDPSRFNSLKPMISRHPDTSIRNLLKARVDQDKHDIIKAPKGGYELVRIPEGSFMMGSNNGHDEQPVHEVHLSEFYLGCYPVTNDEYERYLQANPDVREPKYWADRAYNQPRQPVVGVSWDEANAYAQWAGLHLPTEAQWEYACRAGTTTHYYTGDTNKDLDRAGWCEDNSKRQLHPVGQKEPNAWGLYDMHGNVWEWCRDWYGDNYYAQSPRHDPKGPNNGPDRVVRGGSWYLPAEFCRSAYRHWIHPGNRYFNLGFRLALLPGQQVSGQEKSAECGGD